MEQEKNGSVYFTFLSLLCHCFKVMICMYVCYMLFNKYSILNTLSSATPRQQARELLMSVFRPDSYLHCLLPASRDKDLMAKLRVPRKFLALASVQKIQIIHKFRSPALSVIFILILHTVHCLSCFRLYILACTLLFTTLGLSSLCNVIRSSGRKGV